MFGSPLFGGYQGAYVFEDPFFGDMQETHRRHMSAMQGMYSSGPFMSPMFPTQAAIEGRGSGGHSRELQAHGCIPMGTPMGMFQGISPYGMMGMNSMFDMNSMMGNMQRNMDRMANDPNTHCYSSSSMMSYSNTGVGAPQFYQASSSTRQAPGGVRETRRSVRDSQRAVEKMSIGHHIDERSHVIEKAKNTRTGDMEEKQDFVNIDETDAQDFDTEWKRKTGAGAHQGGGFSVAAGRSRPTATAITDGKEYRHDREHRPTRHVDEDTPHQSVHFDHTERTSNDARPLHRRPTPARPKGPSKAGRHRDPKEL